MAVYVFLHVTPSHTMYKVKRLRETKYIQICTLFLENKTP